MRLLTTLRLAWACLVLFSLSIPYRVEAQEDGTPVGVQETFPELLRNAGFTEGTTEDGFPLHWQRYGGGGKGQRLTIVPEGEEAMPST
ncbi:MAG: hypothetical protein HN742_16915 [Lentisphaerae bacterium]|jgi:hypothetical protein|nr:hypothetical protein [Lentisphaerota bacterium]MBT4818318.1 hypothetical protein [Lentisphaerota bacterium]MBT5604341.1 hypothetical protein [Lentisphaerota bacterium]MBT7054186.1 hypothetical protein [Lentisphaerota bacterium]MBT7843563.1 hypothetical protein [Lentisphaerota bacterium]